MAQIDMSGMKNSFNGFDWQYVNHKAMVSAGVDHYAWDAGIGLSITALSLSGNITYSGNTPIGGTIDAINIRGGMSPIFSITGLSVPLTSLIDTGNSTASFEKFWATTLAGNTTVVMPTMNANVSLMGDQFAIAGAKTLTGGNDTFVGNNNGSSNRLTGDVVNVGVGATLNGGNDVFNGVGGSLVGDVGFDAANMGTVNGGDDRFTATGNASMPVMAFDELAGDVRSNRGTVIGGNDTFTLVNVGEITVLAGDVLLHDENSVVGGDDTISLRRTGNFDVSPTTFGAIIGDVHTSETGTATTGGNDAISVKDASGSFVSGDLLIAKGNMSGGNDTIVVGSSAPLYAGSPAPAPSLPSVSPILGDARDVTAGSTAKGGADNITVTNTKGGHAVGDFYVGMGASHVGGNDTITLDWSQPNLSGVSTLNAFGDFVVLTAGSAVGGNDRLTASVTSNIEDTKISLFGDAMQVTGGTNFTAGNDVLVAKSDRAGSSAELFGDARDVAISGKFVGGNDTITGTNGDDKIYGDVLVVNAVGGAVGGNDILDGRGGNDLIDGGDGNDTAVFSSLAQSVFVCLSGIAGSAANPADYVEAVGQGADQLVSIENVIGSTLGDTITGNAVGNRLSGGGGGDRLDGGMGNDTLDGGAGADMLIGGGGNDTFIVDNAGDKTVEAVNAGADLVKASVSFALAANIENLALTGAGNINGTGNALANAIAGNAGANVLNGGAGADTLTGGAGNDTYLVDNAGDKVVEAANGGVDLVKASVSLTLAANVENLALAGAGNINGTGNALANVIAGNGGANVLNGGDGADTLNGGAGTDTLIGGKGNDTFIVDNAGDKVVEAANSGTDLVKASVSFALAANIENLALTGAGKINGTGNALANSIAGNGDANVLDGGAGADTLTGGAGNDTYVVDNAADKVVEAANGGTDLVKASVSLTLAANVENLALTGSGNINGTGNALANSIAGNAGANVLDGGAGADTLNGGAGNDRLQGGLGNDMLTGGAGADAFTFAAALNAANNVDIVTDFNVAADQIYLSKAIFTKLGAGVVSADAFHKSTTGLAHDASDRIIYETDTGKLFYDADGNGAGAAVQFAKLAPNLALSGADFVVF